MIARWIETIYPAPVDPLNPGFGARWSASLRLARERAAQVCDRAGWWSTLNALVWSLRDGHARLWSRRGSEPVRWTGFAVELQGDRYVLRRVAQEPGADASFEGAVLQSCDGVAIARYAEQTLDLFRGDWNVGSKRPSMTATLLADDGNPFVTPARSCTVTVDGKPQPWSPTWTVSASAEVSAATARFQRIKRSNGETLDLGFVDGGAAWITVGNLADEPGHRRLQKTVAKARRRILRAPYIVWDLRGNGGGNSALGDALARLVWGKGTLASGRPPTHPKRWRISPELVDYVRTSKREELMWIVPHMEKALREGRSLMTLPGDLPRDEPTPVTLATPAATGPVFVLTDAGCFSSCIMFRNLLKRMGAIQVGDPTGRDSTYGESWFGRELPSRLGSVSLPIAIFGDRPEDLGGTPPDIPWTGAADDEAGVREMIAQAAAARGAP